MIKRILLPLDSSEYAKNAALLAVRIAKINNAEISGIVVLDIPGIEKSIGSVPPGAALFAKELEEQRLSEAELHVRLLLKNFSELCSDSNIKYDFHQRQGSPSSKIIEHSLFYDLLILGNKTFYNFEISGKPGDSFDSILDQSITPIISVPEKLPDSVMNNQIIKTTIAFDGSLQSARALQLFAKMRMFDRFDIRIVMASDDIKLAGHYLDDAETFLKPHGFSRIEKINTKDDIVDYIDNNLMEWTDLFVIGAHPKHGILDFMVGSLTKHLIKMGDRLLFIGQ